MRLPIFIASAFLLVIATEFSREARADTSPSAAVWETIAALNFPHDERTAFRETRSSTLLRKPAQRSGTLWIEDGGDFVMQVLEPRPEERRLSGERLQLTRGKKQRSVSLDPKKGAHQLLLSIVAVLEGDVEQLQTGFNLAEQPTTPANATQSWTVTLTPKDATLRKTLQRLVLRGKAASLFSLRAERNSNSWQAIEILSKAIQPATSNATKAADD